MTALEPGQFRVCVFSFHSVHEVDVFRSELSSVDFVFTDLSPVFPGSAHPNESILTRKKAGWFTDRCRPDLSCDVVVYSGEFAGAFFGDFGYAVDLREMEEASCRSTCRGIFRDPREVFLLGCNTLATKSADRRTQQEYLHVLLTHGFSHTEAQRVVAMRYGPLGASFMASQRRIFMEVPRIYGFSSVAPLGEFTAPLLRDYFRRKGDYAEYLAEAGRDSATNRELMTAFAGTGLVQAEGVSALEADGGDRSLVCRLYDDGEAVTERLRIVRELLARPDFLSFLPTIEVFLGRHPPQHYGDSERRILAEIRGLETPRRRVTELIDRLDLSVLKMQLANLARQLGWMTPAEHERLVADGLKELLAKPLSSEVADIGCEMSQYASIGAGLRADDIPEQLLWHAEGYRLLDCLSPADPEVSVLMLRGLGNLDEATRIWAVHSLWGRRPLSDEVLVALAGRLGDSSSEVRERVRRTLRAEAPLSADVLTVVRERDAAFAQTLATHGTN